MTVFAGGSFPRPDKVCARGESTHYRKKTFGDAIIASPFHALDVLVHTGVTLFSRRTNGSDGFRLKLAGFLNTESDLRSQPKARDALR